MGALILAAAALALDSVAQWRPQIDGASARCGIPARWIERVMRSESAGRTYMGGRPIRSRKGAIGLMQLMPGTWAEMRSGLGLGSDPDDPRDNILAGACYLRRMYDRFGYPGLFAAYNAGPGRYAAYLNGRPLASETVAYLAVVGAKNPATRAARVAPMTLFVVRRGAPAAVAAEPVTAPADPLFAVRTGVR